MYELDLHVNSHTHTINIGYASMHTHLELIHCMHEHIHMAHIYASAHTDTFITSSAKEHTHASTHKTNTETVYTHIVHSDITEIYSVTLQGKNSKASFSEEKKHWQSLNVRGCVSVSCV